MLNLNKESFGEQHGTLECPAFVASGAHRVGHPQGNGADWAGTDPRRSLDPP